MKLFGRSKGKSEDNTSNKKTERELDSFSKYLSLWVGVCIVAGTLLGYFFPSLSTFMTKLQFANVSRPIAAVLLMMMYPIMLKVKYSRVIKSPVGVIFSTLLIKCVSSHSSPFFLIVITHVNAPSARIMAYLFKPAGIITKVLQIRGVDISVDIRNNRLFPILLFRQ